VEVNFKTIIFSLLLLAVADASYKFIYVDIGAHGSDSDDGFCLLFFGKKLE